MVWVESELEAEWLVALDLPFPPRALLSALRRPRTRVGPRGRGFPRLDPPRRCTGFCRPLSATPVRKFDATDLGELERRLPDRDGTVPALVLQPVYEVEHVALDPTAEAMEGPLGQVYRAAGLVVVVERAADLQLLAPPDRLEAVVGEDAAEVRAQPEGL